MSSTSITFRFAVMQKDLVLSVTLSSSSLKRYMKISLSLGTIEAARHSLTSSSNENARSAGQSCHITSSEHLLHMRASRSKTALVSPSNAHARSAQSISPDNTTCTSLTSFEIPARHFQPSSSTNYASRTASPVPPNPTSLKQHHHCSRDPDPSSHAHHSTSDPAR